MKQNALLHAENLGYRIGEKQILDSVNLELYPGEILGIIGPNGAGKSTLLKCLMGFYEHQGHVSVENSGIRRIKPGRRAELLSYMSQQGPDQMSFTALEVVEMGAYNQGPISTRLDSRFNDQSLKALEYVGLVHLAGRQFSSLSGGEQQLVMFARLILQNAPIMLLDEPTASLDIGHEQTVLEMAEELRREGKAVVMSLHNLNLAAEFCDRIVVLQHGRVLASGLPGEVLRPDILQQAYGTEVDVQHSPGSGSLLIHTRRRFAQSINRRVHIIGGAGSAVNLTRLLVRQGYSVTGGVAHRLDSDARLWQALEMQNVTVDAFEEISEDAFRRTQELQATADVTVLAAFPVGRGNLRNLELAGHANHLVIMNDIQRSFHTEGAEQLFSQLQPFFEADSSDDVLSYINSLYLAEK